MSTQPPELPGGQRSSVPPFPHSNSAPTSRQAPTQPQTEICPGCHTSVQAGQAVCTKCGTILHSQPKLIRCRSCRKEASSAYTLCPHCGRALVAAPPLLLTLGIPAGVVLLLALILFNQTAGSPFGWAEKQAEVALGVVDNPVLTPVRVSQEKPPVTGIPDQSGSGGSGGLIVIPPTDIPTAALPTDTPEITATPTATLLPTETATTTPTSTETPTNTPSVTATAIQQSGAVVETQTLTPTSTSTATGTARTYIVQEGDTIVSIANRFQIIVADLLTVNRLSPIQALQLKPGTTLVIPGTVPLDDIAPTATPTVAVATATATASQTPTPQPTEKSKPTLVPTATPTPQVTIRLDAPGLIDPAQNINVPCSGEQYIRWNPINGLAPDDEYVLFLGYVNSAPDAAGNVQVAPLLQQRNGQLTNWRMDVGYCGLAPQEFGRRWRWYVQIFNGDTPVSPPSQVWEFTWR